MNQDNLRKQVKHLKTNGVNYNKIAKGINVNPSSFYSWLRGNYQFSFDTAHNLECWIKQEMLDHRPTGRKAQTVRNLISLLNEYEFDDDEEIIELPQYDNAIRYYISNKGRCFSLCGSEWRQKVPQMGTDGYLYVDLYSNGERTRKSIHSLVAEAFLEYHGEDGIELHHLDLDRTNNSVENILPMKREEHAKLHKYLQKWRKNINELGDLDSPELEDCISQ